MTLHGKRINLSTISQLRLIRHRSVLIVPHLFLFASPRRWVYAIDLPKPSLRLVNVDFPIIALICDVRLQKSTNSLHNPLVLGIIIRHADSNVVHREANERFVLSKLASNPNGIDRKLNEVHDDVKPWKSTTPSTVPVRDILGQCLLSLVVVEGSGWMVDNPERHVGGSSNTIKFFEESGKGDGDKGRN